MNGMIRLLALVLALSGVAAGSARADVINFSGLSGVEAPIPNGYAGFAWSNFSSLNTQTDLNVMPSGYLPANVDSASPNVAFNLFGKPASISAGAPFTFVGAFFTAAWRDGLSIEAVGSRNGTPVYDTTFTVNATTPTFELLNFQGIDTLVFTSSGGTPHGYVPLEAASHPPLTQFAMDDVLFLAPASSASVTPEPSGLVLFALGAGTAAVFVRRFRRPRTTEAPA